MRRENDRVRTGPAGTVIAWLLAALIGGMAGIATLASAVEMTSLYTVDVVVDPQDREPTQSANRAALEEVLVRITGRVDAGQSEELLALFPNPARYVLRFQPGPDDTRRISLDGTAIEGLLRRANETVWDSDRPLTLLLLGVDWGQGEREIIARPDPLNDPPVPVRGPGSAASTEFEAQLREQILATVTRRGLPVVLPILDAQDLEVLSFTDLWGGFDDRLQETAARYGATSILVGRVRPDGTADYRWTWYHLDQRRDWTGSAETALNMLGDALANQYALGGDAEIETIRLTISGISSFQAYGETQRLVENVRGIDNLAVAGATPNSISYEVTVQGGSERLARALEQSGLLERVNDRSNAIDAGMRPPATQGIDYEENGLSVAPALEYRYRSD